MNDDLQTQKALLEDNLSKLIEFINDKTEPKEAIWIYEHAISAVRASLKKIEKLEQFDDS